MSSERALFATVGLLTLSLSSLVLFLWQGVALYLRDAGQPSEIVGLLFLAGVPWTLRFLWAPMIDRMGFRGVGRYKSWIVGTQLLIVIGMFGLSLTDPATTPYAIIALLALLSVFMGTQQTAIFGLMAQQLKPDSRVKGMTVQVLAYASAGAVTGLGVLYLLSDLGWSFTVVTIAVVSICFLVVIAPLKLDAHAPVVSSKPTLLSLFSILKDSRVRRLLYAILPVNMAVAATFGLQSLMLLEVGLSVAEAGLVTIVGANAFGFVGGFAAKPLTERLGGYAAITCIGVTLAVSCLIFGALFMTEMTTRAVIALVLTNSLFAFALMPSAKSILMGYCSEGREATDFAAFSGVEGLFFMVAAGVMTTLADKTGYASLFLATACFAVLGAFIAWQDRSQTRPLKEVRT